MPILPKTVLIASALWLGAGAAWADDDDLEGRIEAIHAATQSFVVKGITFHTTPSTDYDDDLKRFSDLRVGMKVEVDYVVRDGKHYAKEIERDD